MIKGGEDRRTDLVIVYGPQGSGKTLNSEAIAKAYGCKSIVDYDWADIKRVLQQVEGPVLVLAPGTPDKPGAYRDQRVRGGLRDPLKRSRKLLGEYISIAMAAIKVGEAWKEPGQKDEVAMELSETPRPTVFTLSPSDALLLQLYFAQSAPAKIYLPDFYTRRVDEVGKSVLDGFRRLALERKARMVELRFAGQALCRLKMSSKRGWMVEGVSHA